MATSQQYNTHHLLFTKKNWGVGNAKRLRESLTFKIPVDIHNALHRELSDVPLPPPNELSRLLRERQNFPYTMELFDAMRWLLSSAEDEDFLKAIAKQYVFLVSRGVR